MQHKTKLQKVKSKENKVTNPLGKKIKITLISINSMINCALLKMTMGMKNEIKRNLLCATYVFYVSFMVLHDGAGLWWQEGGARFFEGDFWIFDYQSVNLIFLVREYLLIFYLCLWLSSDNQRKFNRFLTFYKI
jgi:hypothetical protein